MTELEYYEALELAAEKLTRSIENYKTVDRLRAEVETLREENDFLRETITDLRERREYDDDELDYRSGP